MIILTTATAAAETFGKAALALVLSLLFYWAGRPGPQTLVDVRRLYWYVSAVLMLIGTGLLIWSLAVSNCPPDSYECPI